MQAVKVFNNNAVSVIMPDGKQLLPGKIGQRQSAAPCERVLRRYDQVKGVVQDGEALDLRLQRPKGQIEGCVCLAAEHFVGVA